MCRLADHADPIHLMGGPECKNNQYLVEPGNIFEENLALVYRCEPTDSSKANSNFAQRLSEVLTHAWHTEKYVQLPTLLINKFNIELVCHQHVIVGNTQKQQSIDLTKEQIQELLEEIYEAAKEKNDSEAVNLARQLGQKYINEKNPNDYNVTTLHYATGCCLEKTFDTCMELGASVDVKNDNWDDAPIHYACSGGSLRMVQKIVNKDKQQANKKNSGEDTPLHWCCYDSDSKRSLDKIKWLVSNC